MTDAEIIEQYQAEEKLIEKDPKVLEFLTEYGSWASEPVLDNIVYDTELGYKKKFYIRNTSKILTATLRDVEFSDPKWLFHGPKNNEIYPLQTIAVMLEIPPDKESKVDTMSGSLEEDKRITFKGIISWAVRPTLKNFEEQLEKKFEEESNK